MFAESSAQLAKPARARVAVIGSGISGLAAAHTLQGLTDVTLFEAGDYFGGHTHTVDVTLPDAQGREQTFGVDTGFLVLNERTYPNLLALLAQLDVPVVPSDMSFSVQAQGMGPGGGKLEWSGTSLSSVFAQRANLVNPSFLRMLADVVRFNRLTTRLAEQGLDKPDGPLMQPLRDFLREHRFSDAFRDGYFLPMLGCIWSCPTDQMLAFPVATMVRFCHNHGLIQLTQRPQWFTVPQGARRYVQKILQGLPDARLNSPVRQLLRDDTGVRVVTDTRVEHFDAVVMACHSDQSLAILGDNASDTETDVLSAIRYQPNEAVLHTDVSVLPERPLAWASWNYERASDTSRESAQVCLHYLLNKLQPLPVEQAVIVSLNPNRPVAAEHVIDRFEYAHPVFDLDAIRAQGRVPALQGQQRTYFAGAWMGYGFHEDGLKAGLQAARQLIGDLGLQAQPDASALRQAALPGVFA
jgi:predicted NAD/FAD-binding protein